MDTLTLETSIPFLGDFVQEIYNVLGNNTAKIILYGSFARGEQTENSDVDLMILTTINDSQQIEQLEKQLYAKAFEYELEYSRRISVIIHNDTHFYNWIDDLPFYRNVENEGVLLGVA